MDLGTIKTKIENNQYKEIEEIAEDIRLVWRNCMIYNRDGSEVHNVYIIMIIIIIIKFLII